jgi:membrane protein
MKYLKYTWELLRDTVQEFINDNAIKFSASLAYYTVFSLPPLLIVVISLSGLFYGKEAVQGKVYAQITDIVGPDTALQIEQMIKDVRLKGNTHLSTLIGMIVLVIGATGVFTEIQDSINIIWGVKAKPKRGWLKIIVNRIISFSMIISIGFVLLVSLIMNALMLMLSTKLTSYFPVLTLDLLHVFNFILTFGIITLLFSIIFKFLPDAYIRWKDVGVGALATAVLFIIGKFAITFYLAQTDFATANGTAGSIVVLLIWIYYSSVILFLGAEFTQVYSHRYGRKIIPTEYAVFVEIKEVEKVKE